MCTILCEYGIRVADRGPTYNKRFIYAPRSHGYGPV